jgi:hypothetical protein
MCEYCRTSPCPPPCPNATPRRVVGVCSVCKEEVVVGEKFFQLSDDELVHKDCARDLAPEEIFTLTNTNPASPFRHSDIDAEMFLNAFDIYTRTTRGE